ncbi:YqgE/AlgH family protein [Deltaproteobacteria bacterium IMCC39524]|nr:YqgE/AlgH family protein [Deltaproteobacteria bacterium IMCC39524]
MTLLVLLAMTNVLYATTPEKGMFLVADEQLKDPRFRNGVILLIQHNQQGSAGLVVNRGSRLSLSTILPKDSSLTGDGGTLSYGGPVDPNTLLALVKVRKHPPEPAEEVVEGLYVTGVGVLDEWTDFSAEVVSYRAFVGYTGWAAGQLGAEIQRGDWSVLQADAESVLTGDQGQLWKRLREALPK